MISTEFPHLPRPIVPAINCDGKVLSFQISEFFAKNCLFHRREKVLEFLRSTCSAPRPAGPDLGALHSPATRRLVQVVDFQLGVGVYKFIVAQAVFECGQASSHRLRPARAPPALPAAAIALDWWRGPGRRRLRRPAAVVERRNAPGGTPCFHFRCAKGPAQ